MVGTLRVNEVFYSLQGEGRRAGEPSVFVRLSGCSVAEACWQSGIRCDTEFTSGRELTYAALLERVSAVAQGCKWIVWTGGEPTDQLREAAVQFFAAAGFKQAIETSGVRPVPPGLDWVTVSPKVAEHVLKRAFICQRINELKYVRCIGHSVPEPLVTADHYYIQPHATGSTVDPATLNHCIELCKANPQWTLSLQTHKLLQIR